MIKNLIKHLQVPNRFILTIGINPAILLTELIDKERYLMNEKKLDDHNYFFHEYKFIYKNTGLLKSKFTNAKNKLIKTGIIETKYWEWKRLLYKINNTTLLSIFFPKSIEELDHEDFLELLLDDGYIFYPAVLAHKLWINETIFIKSLASKRKSFLNKNQLINWYFFNSVSNIKKDTSLSRDQQLKCIKNLVELNLIDVKYDYDNTRYFCINLELLSKFESIELNDIIKVEVWFNDKIESWINDKKNIILINPFIKKEDWNNDKVESWFNYDSEVIKEDDTETIFTDDKKSPLSTTWNSKSLWVEVIKPYINNNKKENKQIKENNNTKTMLLNFFDNDLFVDKLLLTYDQETLIKVIKEANYRDLENKAWFIRWALENKIDFTKSKDKLKEKINQKKYENKLEENKELEEREKIIEEKKKYYEWKTNNISSYNEIYEKIKTKLNNWNISTIRLNIEAEINARKYILENYINNNKQWELVL